MLVPLLAWATTGVVFLTKPGYDEAYEKLSIKTYQLDPGQYVSTRKDWQEVRLVQSILGVHLLARTDGGFRQYDPKTHLPSRAPTERQIAQLITDAIQMNPDRYGAIERIEGFKATTTTGIEIQLDWDQMKLSQRGTDRKIIETLYKIHYLQWTKWDNVNLILGIIGLCSLVSLTILGLVSYFSKPAKDS